MRINRKLCYLALIVTASLSFRTWTWWLGDTAATRVVQ